MKPEQIRPIVIRVLRDGDRVFVAEYHDPSRGETFYRPLGGAIEFGERSPECIVREIGEEVDAEIQDLHYLGVIENIFTDGGKPCHEIVLVYEARFRDPQFYQVSSVECQVEEFVAVWKPIDEFQTGKAQVYPVGLLELLDKPNKRSKP